MEEIKVKIRKRDYIDKIWNKNTCKTLTPDNYYLEDMEIIFRERKNG